MEKQKSSELDLTSPNLDPLKVLYAPIEDVRVPRSNARRYDNVAMFEETEEGIFPKQRKEPSRKTAMDLKPAETTENPPKDVSSRKPQKNVLTRMDQTVKGPLNFLKICMDKKLRVKVYIRSAASIRGFCIGFVEAFDKHWNVVLKDVFETWNRPRKKRSNSFVGQVVTTAVAVSACKETGQDYDESNLLPGTRNDNSLHKYDPEGCSADRSQACYRIPRWIVKRKLKKKEVCERHVDQMMIRGEQIVLVTSLELS